MKIIDLEIERTPYQIRVGDQHYEHWKQLQYDIWLHAIGRHVTGDKRFEDAEKLAQSTPAYAEADAHIRSKIAEVAGINRTTDEGIDLSEALLEAARQTLYPEHHTSLADVLLQAQRKGPNEGREIG